VVFNTGPYTVLPENSILITANMQLETGFPSSHQLKSYVAYKCRLKLAARAVLSADAGLLVLHYYSKWNSHIKPQNQKNNHLQCTTSICICFSRDDYKCCLWSDWNHHSLASGALRPFREANNNNM